MKVLSELISSETSLPGLVDAFSLCHHMASSLCVHGEKEISCSSYKDKNPTGLGSHVYDLIER